MNLLVHIGASTSRADDEHFRRQARAYVNYQPSATLHISEPDAPTQRNSTQKKMPGISTMPMLEQTGDGLLNSSTARTPTEIPTVCEVPATEMQSRLRSHLDGLDARNFPLLPMSSPFERLEALQSRRPNNMTLPSRVSCTPLNAKSTVESVQVADTQFAVSAIESQLITQWTPCCTTKQSPALASSPRSLKRRRVDEEGQMHDETDVSLEFSLPRAATTPRMFGTEVNAPAESLSKRQKTVPKTPEPDSMTSVLPSDYGLSDTTTETSARRSQRTAARSQEAVVQTALPNPFMSSPSITRRSLPVHEAPFEHDPSAHGKAIHIDLSERRSDAAPAPAVPDEALSRQPLQVIRPNASPPKNTEATTASMSEPGRRTTSRSSPPKTPIVRDFALEFSAKASKSSLAVVTIPLKRPRAAMQVLTSASSLDQPPLEARAPPPPVGLLPALHSQITRKLQTLMDLQALATRYKPATVSRPIAVDERGRWEFHLDSDDEALQQHWSAHQQVQFWQSLCQLTGDGSLGWGVWCIRCPEMARTAVQSTEAANDQDKQAVLGRVRLFCWGEIVQHIWLLLYTLSNNKIRKVDARWIDSRGEVVVQMPLRQ